MTNHYADAIAISIWEISTGNGRDLDRDLWDSHMQNCDAAAANTFYDGITDSEWHAAALARVQ
jgi:hypothetical protein